MIPWIKTYGLSLLLAATSVWLAYRMIKLDEQMQVYRDMVDLGVTPGGENRKPVKKALSAQGYQAEESKGGDYQLGGDVSGGISS